jgi:hypothetical protein
MKKKKPSVKKTAKKKKSKTTKKPKRGKPTAKGKARKGATPTQAAVTAAVALADDPVGACSWTDASGQNHCKITTQSLCKNIPGSTFDAGKQCV